MRNIDYEELLRSPLDNGEGRDTPGWATWVGGIVLGLVAGYLATVGVGGADEPTGISSTVATTSTTTPEVANLDYPEGYVEISDSLAAVVNEVILGEDVITVSLTTAAKRGEDPGTVAWPVGGVWVLESSSGASVESSRVVVGRYSPGAFSVQFPAAQFSGETQYTRLNLVERWDTEQFTGSIEAPFDGAPFIAPEMLTSPVNQEVTLFIPSLSLGRFLGSAEWETSGAEFGTTAHIGATLYDENGDRVGSYNRGPEIIDPAEHGVIEIYWSEPFPTGQEGAASVAVQYTVGVVARTPVSVEFDVANVPVGR